MCAEKKGGRVCAERGEREWEDNMDLSDDEDDVSVCRGHEVPRLTLSLAIAAATGCSS